MNRNAWHLGLAGMSMIGVAFGFARYGYGLFVSEFREEFALSTGALGLISSGSYATYLVALLLAGFLSSRINPRIPVLLAGFSAAGGTALVAAAPNAAVMATGVLLASTSPGWAWAPFSDAIAQSIRPEAHNRTLSIVSTGTTLGLFLAGPIALFAGPAWRLAWLIFAVLALASTVWNARLLPNRAYRGTPPAPDGDDHDGADDQRATKTFRLRWRWYVNMLSLPLFLVAFVFGFSGAFYWTYAADLALDSGLPTATRTLLWSLVGITGAVGLATGDLVDRFGLRTILAAALTMLATAIALLGVAPGSWVAVSISAALYGPSFMLMSALLALWSSEVFPDRPSAGFTATLLLLALGSMAGPATLGVLAGTFTLPSLFLAAATLTLLGLLGAIPGRAVHRHHVEAAGSP